MYFYMRTGQKRLSTRLRSFIFSMHVFVAGQHSGVSIQVSDAGKEPDRSCEVSLCPQCSSSHKGRSQCKNNFHPQQESGQMSMCVKSNLVFNWSETSARVH